MRGTATRGEYLNAKMLGALGLAVAWCCSGCVVSFDAWPDPRSTGGINSIGGSMSSGGVLWTGGTGTNATTGGAGGIATTSSAATGGVGTPSTVWFTFEDDQAKNTASPNDSLGINGQLIAYNDRCSDGHYAFDKATRCASGSTCAVDTGTYANWGMAVEFDFVVEGNNVKRTWNPADHAVIGFAWEITNTYGTTLQLWVPLMDPTNAGSCNTDTCSLNAPPYGAGRITTSGSLYLNAMTKDIWGGSYPSYNFTSANVYSLQFKIPTVIIQNAVTFNFCIDRLGVIVSQ